MPIYAGNSKIKEIYTGNSKIKEVWAGNNLVYRSSIFKGLSIKDLCFLHVTADNSSEYWGICSEEWFNLMTGLSAYNFEFTSITCDYPEIEDDVYSLYAWRHTRKAINITASFPSGYDFLVMGYSYNNPISECVPTFGTKTPVTRKMVKVTGDRVLTFAIPSTAARAGSCFVTAVFKIPPGYNSAPNISLGLAVKSTNNAAVMFNEFNENKIFSPPSYQDGLNLYITGPAGTTNDQPVQFLFEDNVSTQIIQQETIWEDPSTPMLATKSTATSGVPYIPYIGFKTNTGPS